MKENVLKSKRFVVRQSLIGKNQVIVFTNKKGDTVKYNHDEVYTRNKERFESMNCFKKYKSYTNTNNIPTFCRQLVKHEVRKHSCIANVYSTRPTTHKINSTLNG